MVKYFNENERKDFEAKKKQFCLSGKAKMAKLGLTFDETEETNQINSKSNNILNTLYEEREKVGQLEKKLKKNQEELQNKQKEIQKLNQELHNKKAENQQLNKEIQNNFPSTISEISRLRKENLQFKTKIKSLSKIRIKPYAISFLWGLIIAISGLSYISSQQDYCYGEFGFNKIGCIFSDLFWID